MITEQPRSEEQSLESPHVSAGSSHSHSSHAAVENRLPPSFLMPSLSDGAERIKMVQAQMEEAHAVPLKKQQQQQCTQKPAKRVYSGIDLEIPARPASSSHSYYFYQPIDLLLLKLRGNNLFGCSRKSTHTHTQKNPLLLIQTGVSTRVEKWA